MKHLPPFPTLGSIERYSPKLDELLDIDTPIEQLAEGFKWTEGPAWDSARERLLFSDIPNNRIHSWDSESGLGVAIEPAGASHGPIDIHAAPGTNGLFYQPGQDALLVCNQDGRSVDQISLADGQRRVLAGRFEGKKFNSPNDVIQASDGTVYFTDPPYGLKDGNASAGREMKTKGVYSVSPEGRTKLLINDMTFPNGLALSPDERHLFVSQSDPGAAFIRRFSLLQDGILAEGEVWLDTTADVSPDNPGLPDGMAFDHLGNLFATGPGGVIVLAPDGEALGLIRTGKATANCAFGEDGSTLFMTATNTLLRIRTKTRGALP